MDLFISFGRRSLDQWHMSHLKRPANKTFQTTHTEEGRTEKETKERKKVFFHGRAISTSTKKWIEA
jgi:hypothetical protein